MVHNQMETRAKLSASQFPNQIETSKPRVFIFFSISVHRFLRMRAGNPMALQKAKYNVDKHFAVVGLLGKLIQDSILYSIHYTVYTLGYKLSFCQGYQVKNA